MFVEHVVNCVEWKKEVAGIFLRPQVDEMHVVLINQTKGSIRSHFEEALTR